MNGLDPVKMSEGVAVVGIGNLVHCDDGVGIHAIELLKLDPRVPPGVVLVDGGTQGLSLLPYIVGFPRLLVVDAVDAGQPPGSLLCFKGTALDGLPGKATVHQLGFADLMAAMHLMGNSPGEIVVIGVQPLSTDWVAELTAPVQEAMGPLIDAVINQLNTWNATPYRPDDPKPPAPRTDSPNSPSSHSTAS